MHIFCANTHLLHYTHHISAVSRPQQADGLYHSSDRQWTCGTDGRWLYHSAQTQAQSHLRTAALTKG